MIINFQISYDTETGKATVHTEKPKESKKVSGSAEVVREDGKLILSSSTISLLGAQPEDKIVITYDKVGAKFLPVISIDNEKGNKLTKSGTVSYRGKANTELARYGTYFSLKPGKRPNTFYLEGEINESTDSRSEIFDPDSSEIERDLPEDIPFTLGLDLDTDDVSTTEKITEFSFNDIEL
jgi:hypothetical protein